MRSTRTSRTGLAAAAALLLGAGGLAAYVVGEQAARKAPGGEATSAPRPQAKGASGRGPEDEPRILGPLQPASGAAAPGGAQPPTGASVPADDQASSPEADRLMKQMKKLASDLEYNANRGLKEPPQQVVPPLPDPWRPPPGAATEPPPLVEQVTPARGPPRGGVKVTLRGRNLRDPQVMFGASPASVVKSTASEVTVLAPPSPPGPVTIAVTNADGTYVLLAGGFTYGD